VPILVKISKATTIADQKIQLFSADNQSHWSDYVKKRLWSYDRMAL